jgi:hypothetical protein
VEEEKLSRKSRNRDRFEGKAGKPDKIIMESRQLITPKAKIHPQFTHQWTLPFTHIFTIKKK